MVKTKISFLILLMMSYCISANAAVWVQYQCDSLDKVPHWDYAGTVDITNDTTSPDTTSSVCRFTYPPGIVSKDIAMVYFSMPKGTTEFWVQYYWKYSSDFVFHGVANKQLYVYSTGFGTTHSSNFGVVENSGYLRMVPQGTWSASLKPNINTGTWYGNTGKWHKAKYYFKFNSPGDTYNGIYKLWVDDVLVSDHRGVQYDRRSEAYGWEGLGIRPIWGGISDQQVPATQYFYMDGLYAGTSDPGGGTMPAEKTPMFPMSPTNLNIE
jgi:hypothetical protein